MLALAECPGINRQWALTGLGEPLLSPGHEASTADSMLPLAKRLLPGPIDAHRDRLSDAYLPVLRHDYRSTRYWFEVDDANQVEDGLMVGDALLIESDRAWLDQPPLLQNNWCVLIQPQATEPLLRRIADCKSPGRVIIAPTSSPSSARLTAPPPLTIPGGAGMRRALLRRPELEQAQGGGLQSPRRPDPTTIPDTASTVEKADVNEVDISLDAVVGVVVLQQRRWPWR
jgi:hypothetical protein